MSPRIDYVKSLKAGAVRFADAQGPRACEDGLIMHSMIGDQKLLDEGLRSKSKREVLEKLNKFLKKNMVIKAS